MECTSTTFTQHCDSAAIVENLLHHYSFSNGSLTEVNDNLIDVTFIYIGSTLGEIPGTKSSRA
jgi:hypothetical protein